MRGREDQNTTIGPPAKQHLNSVLLAERCWLDFQGIQTGIAKKLYIFVIIQGESGPPVPLDPHMQSTLDPSYKMETILEQRVSPSYSPVNVVIICAFEQNC